MSDLVSVARSKDIAISIISLSIYLSLYINARCVASTHVASFLSVQVHGESHALTCRPAGFTRRQRARSMVSSLMYVYLSP